MRRSTRTCPSTFGSLRTDRVEDLSIGHRAADGQNGQTVVAISDRARRLSRCHQPAVSRPADENLAGHLQSPDFFDAERFPEISFTAREISLDGETVKVEGDLTIKGVTHAADVTGTVTAPLTDPYGRERIGLTLETRVDRTQFGVSWNNPLPNGEPALANDVTVVAELFFVKAA